MQENMISIDSFCSGLSGGEQPLPVKLSICIATFNRAEFIGATLESIIGQATRDCEIVISDNASSDRTEEVVSEYACRFEHFRYVRQDTNRGLDRNFDSAVGHARGEYCWLLPDDDLLKPGAVASVLRELRRDFSLVVVNSEFTDFNASKVLQRRCVNFELDRIYGPDEMDRLFEELGIGRNYIGGVVIKRNIWIARERERYYGSLFIHIGVIFQERLPGKVLVIAEPLVSYRFGNMHEFSPRVFEHIMVGWPSLVASLDLSEAVKSRACSSESWRSVGRLLFWRGWGVYSLDEYRRWIHPRVRSMREALVPAMVALLPGTLVNLLLVGYYSARHRTIKLQLLKESPFHFRNWRVSKRAS